MSNDDPEAKAVTEVAKAAQALAKTTGKGIDAGRELGQFVARFVGGPLEQGGGIVEDKLKYMRWERQVRLMVRAEEFLKQQGLEAPTRPVPMKVAIPLFQAASLEEDDELQDRWARLLVNAADVESGVDVTRSLVRILEDFDPLDAQVLEAIHDAPKDLYPNGAVIPTSLPHAYDDPSDNADPKLPPEPVQLALWNLKRLGCIDSAGTWDSIVGIHRVEITPLGTELIRACTFRESGEDQPPPALA